MNNGDDMAYEEARKKSDGKGLGRYLNRFFGPGAVSLGHSNRHDMLSVVPGFTRVSKSAHEPFGRREEAEQIS